MTAPHPPYYWGLSLIDANIVDHDHYARGAGYVKIELTDAGRAIFGKERTGLMDLHYGNGPLFEPAGIEELSDYVPLAYYRTGKGAGGAKPETQVDTPAIIAGAFGKGRVLASSGHTGWTEGLENFFPTFVLWSAGRINGVLPSNTTAAGE